MNPNNGDKMLKYAVTLLFSVIFAVTSFAGIPEPGILLYGQITDDTGVVAVNGTIVWTYTPQAGGNAISITGNLSKIEANGKIYSYTLQIPCETIMPESPLSTNTLQLTASSVMYNRSVKVGTQNAILQGAPTSVAVSTANRGVVEQVDLKVSGRLTFSHPADANADWRMNINEITAYAAAWKIGQSWPKIPYVIPIEYVTNAGSLWRIGEVFHCDMSQSPPLVWQPGAVQGLMLASLTQLGSAGADLPNRFISVRPDTTQGLHISIQAIPPSGTSAWAFEDAPPAGLKAKNINEDGAWDGNGQKVKWGPFWGELPHQLEYDITTDTLSPGEYTFDGTFSFDGSNLNIQRASHIRIGTDRSILILDNNAGTKEWIYYE